MAQSRISVVQKVILWTYFLRLILIGSDSGAAPGLRRCDSNPKNHDTHQVLEKGTVPLRCYKHSALPSLQDKELIPSLSTRNEWRLKSECLVNIALCPSESRTALQKHCNPFQFGITICTPLYLHFLLLNISRLLLQKSEKRGIQHQAYKSWYWLLLGSTQYKNTFF